MIKKYRTHANYQLPRVLAACLLLAGSAVLRAENEVVPSALQSHGLAGKVAWDYVQAKKAEGGEALDWEKFSANNGIKVGATNDRARKLGEAWVAVSAEFDPSSKYFADALNERMGAGKPAADGQTSEKGTKATPVELTPNRRDEILEAHGELGKQEGTLTSYSAAQKKALETETYYGGLRADKISPHVEELKNGIKTTKGRIKELEKSLVGQPDEKTAPLRAEATKVREESATAARAEKLDAKKTGPNFPLVLEVKDEPASPFFVQAGVRSLAPYKVEAATNKLLSGESNVTGFIELGFSTFWASSPARIDQWLRAKKVDLAGIGAVTEDYADGKWETFAWSGWDFDGRFSVNLSDTAEYSASSLVGAGNLNAEINADKLIHRGFSGDRTWSAAIGARAGGSATDDFVVHPDMFVGLRLNFGKVMGSPEDPRMALFRFGLGAAWVDELKTTISGTDRIAVAKVGGGYKYRDDIVPALEFEVVLPVKNLQTVRVAGRIYGDMNPTPWTITAGYSLDLAKLMSGFVGFRDNYKKTDETPAGTNGK